MNKSSLVNKARHVFHDIAEDKMEAVVNLVLQEAIEAVRDLSKTEFVVRNTVVIEAIEAIEALKKVD